MTEQRYIYKNNKKLRCGYTTGTCAAAAARRAAEIALNALPPGSRRPVFLQTPGGLRLDLLPEGEEGGGGCGLCWIRKDSGDDPDVTNGIRIGASVTLEPRPGEDLISGGEAETVSGSEAFPVIRVEGGEGVGRVTRPGLACPVGSAAINPVPRQMIEEQIRAACLEKGFRGRVTAEILVPEGREIAARTYNPKLGIRGGISILGTSGIVEPMSDAALIATIRVEMNMQKAGGTDFLILTPGNYGETFLRNSWQDLAAGRTGAFPRPDSGSFPEDRRPGIRGKGAKASWEEKPDPDPFSLPSVKCANFIGEALDQAAEAGFKGILLVGHIGKLSKVAAGVLNTHSALGDRRMEALADQSGGGDLSAEQAAALRKCALTDEALELLIRWGKKEAVMKRLLEKIETVLAERAAAAGKEGNVRMKTGAVLFSNRYGYLGKTENAAELILALEEQRKLRKGQKKKRGEKEPETAFDRPGEGKESISEQRGPGGFLEAPGGERRE